MAEKTQDYTNLEPARLLEREKEIRGEWRKLRFDKTLSKLQDTSKLKKCRKELARVLTQLTIAEKRVKADEKK
ncbi:MAG: 50S ribosomal protein L29 [Spirochaetes bacterium GWF1_41_5]|nr:MAG: 50S ribosomal protein L29 [Spirochaetes bacterium GWF1_41_5]HBE03488.1 50S ribosomal protein L29 [Spirochaetia bacterium]